MTTADKNKIFQCISTDFKIVVRKTELWEMVYCEEILHDLGLLMEHDYINAIHLIMKGQSGNVIRAFKYHIDTSTSDQSEDKPGNIDWDGLDGTSLSVVVSYTSKWHNLQLYEKNQFNSLLIITWYSNYESLYFSQLSSLHKKTYSASSFTVKRDDFQ